MKHKANLKASAAWYVYTLTDPRSGAVFYVGKGTKNRLHQHELDAADPSTFASAKIRAIRDIWAAKAKVVKAMVAYFWDEQAAYDHETDLISAIGLHNLTNVMPGGHKAFAKREGELSERRSACDFRIRIGDTRRDCMGQPPEFVGMYINLLMAAWEAGGHLVDDERQLCRISGATPEQWIEHRQALANLFVPRNGVWSHNLIREELHKAANISERRRAASQKGNEARWEGARMAKQATDALMAQITADGGAF